MAGDSGYKRELDGLRIDRSKRATPPAPRLSRLWIFVGVAVLVAVGAWRITVSSFGATEVAVHRVTIPRSSSAGSAIVLQAAGYVVPHYRIEVASKVMGRVKWMGVEKGDKVVGGQEIVRLEDDEYRARLIESLGALGSLKARLAELHAGSRPEEIQRAEADLAEADAQFRQAKIDFDRAKQLWADGVIAESEYDQSRYRLDALVNRVASLRKTLELLRLGPRQEDIDSAAEEVRRAEGMVAYNQTIVDATVIRAPVTGTVLERNVEVGELVTTGFVGERGAKGYAVAMADLNDIQVELDISQDDFSRVFMKQKAIVATDAYRDREYRGEVVEISPEADRQKATVQVKVQILEPDELIRPEMNANVSFLAATEGRESLDDRTTAPRVIIPSEALIEGKSVFLIVDGRAVMRPVRIVRSTTDGVEIEEGLAGGEDIILAPPEDLKDGDRVTREGS
ncbi:MAG: efflux RND transporter periplasmic adaptor subunit [Bryobacterales bacterium]|nr:efflux RND transporter periplasmic adaptor subunit [Bryobacterales bacterium]